MATDLTERLAAKLGRGECVTIDGERMVYLVRAKYLLPLLLSEPELVASLPDEVRWSVLTEIEAAQMDVGYCYLRWVKAGRPRGGGFLAECLLNAETRYLEIALAEARALTPEGKDG